MKRFSKAVAAVGISAAAALGLVGCTSDADVVSENISKDADNFNVSRRIVFYNGITDKYMLEITGKCNIVEEGGTQLEVTCKAGGGEYKKHFLGLSDNTTYVVEQVEASAVSADHYKVVFKPSTIVPDVDVK